MYWGSEVKTYMLNGVRNPSFIVVTDGEQKKAYSVLEQSSEVPGVAILLIPVSKHIP
jgi:hypothetical protein